MKSDLTYFTKEAIIQFLGNHGREKTKDYEFAAALALCCLCERRWNEKGWIGVRIKSEYSAILPAFGTEREITLEDITQLFRRGIDEDSPVDFVVAKRASMQKSQGMVFQTKRFGIGREKKDTDELIAYLNSFSRKYPKTNANLLICLDDGVSVDLSKLYANLNTPTFPFNRLMFFWISNNMVYLKDVYPQGNTATFPITEIYSLGEDK